MKLCFVYITLFLGICLHLCDAYPANAYDNSNVSRSVFGQPFDEIIVESSLTVKRKNPSRQERNHNFNKEIAVGESNRNKRHVQAVNENAHGMVTVLRSDDMEI
ncbi:hypothetical protein AMK59_6834 [Oryctes borbonicus]|uniref:Uncharacterized protein n=1 Tax=Oryctes borbonicus TaxID=1629725 RepID=A0A0T6AWM6_9SCAR|nr:hypothetical protein AMK59_6834 [Oryctes borbonicus]